MATTRHSKKAKDLGEEVKIVFPQDEHDGDCVKENELFPKTPQTNRAKDVATPRSSTKTVLQELFQTPRRSCRKSIKPSQDYEDIVNKSLRSSTRTSKSHLQTTEQEYNEKNQEDEVVVPKWTPAKVGRVSQKRGRKSRRIIKALKHEDEDSTQFEDRAKVYEKDGQCVEIVEIPKATEISGHNVQFDEIGCNAKNENIVQQLEPIEENATEDPQSESNKTIVREVVEQKEKVDEIVNNMEILNVKAEYNICQETRNEFQQEEADKPLILIQEESDDCEEFSEKSEQQAICIVYEDNISNSEIYPKGNVQRENVDESSFGCYLKSKDMKFSDLGLNPLKDDEEENAYMEVNSSQIKPISQGAEEMPSLIICDDDEMNSCNKLNETFEANDSVKIVELFNESNTKAGEEIMESLQLSDDENETPRKQSPKMPSSPNALLSTPSSSTYKQSKPIRHPTPYINKKNFRFNAEVKDSTIHCNTSTNSLTFLEPKEIVLRGIRKRSLSVCIEGQSDRKVKQNRVVSFYSPANQTAIIDDLDLTIEKSLETQKLQEKGSLNKFITTRRKRSISLDESIISNSLPRPVANIANKSNTSSVLKPPLRTKLPNFAAIHQKQFKKMENLVEHVNRKQERSKNLINSANKLRPVSSQKNVSINKNSNNMLPTEKPKASKKIDMGSIPQISKNVFNSTITMATPNKVSETKKIINLPDPRKRETKSIKLGTISHRPPQQQMNKSLKSTQTVNIQKPRLNTKTVAPQKPTFNLSTSVIVKPTTSLSNVVHNANTSHMSGDKTSSRLQRHMDLFKGRGATSTRSGATSRKNDVVLKGVRSNRRFELQMQHRKNLEQ